MKQIIYLMIIMSLTFLACNKDNEGPQTGVIVENHVTFRLMNSLGQDLLDPLTPNHFTHDNISVYYIKDGERYQDRNALNEVVKNYRIVKNSKKEYFITIYTDTNSDNPTSEENGIKYGEANTLLYLNESTLDTIKSSWKKGKGYFFIQKVWYNNLLILDNPNSFSKLEVIK